MLRPKMGIIHTLILGCCLILTNIVARNGFLAEGATKTGRRMLVPPQNVTAIEGDRAAKMNCSVSDGSGGLQWVHNGFALGYVMTSNLKTKLKITHSPDKLFTEITVENVTLEDAGVFECQLGPAKGHKPERQKANLIVLAPPKSISINGMTQYGNVEYKEGQEVVLTCEANGANPAADLIWTFNYQTLVNNTRYRIVKRTEPITQGESSIVRYKTYSTLRFIAIPAEDYAEYTCQANHAANRKNRYMRTSVMLSVLYAPTAPVIEGHDRFEANIMGTTLSLTCISHGGNPPASLTWYKNQMVISRQFKTTMRKSESALNITLQRSDHGAKFRCEAANTMTPKPKEAYIITSVLFPPENVTVVGPSEVRAGQTVTLECATTLANPPVNISWIKDGEDEVINQGSAQREPAGWRTFSNFTFVPEPDQIKVDIICRAIHQTGAIVETTYPVSVIQPPKSIMISGHDSSALLVSGTHVRLLCLVTGGNPPPALTWYKDHWKNRTTTVHAGSTTTALLDIIVDITDNLATYRCEAANPALTHPLSTSVQLNVQFPPETVDVYTIPEKATVGSPLRLHCDSSSSNPRSEVTWWKNGIPMAAQPMNHTKGLFGGQVSSVEVVINVTRELDGATFTCQASNVLQEKTVYNSMVLNVEYPPEIDNKTNHNVTVMENELLEIKLEAHGNPNIFTWTWSKDGLPITLARDKKSDDRIYADGGVLKMTSVNRYDAGVYTVEVLNARGAVTTNIIVNVQFAAEIKSLSQLEIPNLNEDAVLACYGDGNPFTADHIRWEREGYDIKPEMVSFNPNNRTSYLNIPKVTRQDIGYFNCVVNNGIGAIISQEIMLKIRIPPEIDSSPKYLKYATKVGGAAGITCISKAVPVPTFTWRRNGFKIAVNTTKKFIVEHYKTDQITYVNILHITEVGSSDFGVYDCEARNELGHSNQPMKLEVLGPPDPVLSLIVTNVTYNSISVSWEPGFDGGLPTQYRIRYRTIEETSYQNTDYINATSYTIHNLKKSRTYVVSIMAVNDAGQSRYLPDDTRATTLSSSGVEDSNEVATQSVETVDVSKSVVVYVSIAAAALVAVNAVLVACFVYKRRARRGKDESTDKAKTQQIEMYGPASSYNETVTGETMSSVSDKSIPFGFDHEQEERGSLPAVPPRDMHQPSETFVTEQDIIPSCDYPPNYAMYEGDHARTLPHAHKHKEFTGHTTLGRNAGRSVYVPSPSPMPPIDGSYSSMYNDRYLSYPPVIEQFLPHQRGTRTPTPPHQIYATTSHPKHVLSNGGASGNPSSAQHQQIPDPLGSYFLDVHHDRPNGGGTLRRRPELNPVPPPDVTVMHQGNCPQHHLPPTPGPVKHPQSILKDPSRHKYGNNTFGSPLSSSSPQNNNSSQILAVHNLSEIPQYGTIRKENKKQNVTIDEGYNRRNDNVV